MPPVLRILPAATLALISACNTDPQSDAGGDASESGSSSDDADPFTTTTPSTTAPTSTTPTTTDPTGPLDTGPVDTGPNDTGCVPRQCGVEIACGNSDDGCGTALECGACGEGTPVEGIAPARVLADPSRGVLLATVTSTSPAHANELVVIDPETATVTASVFVGSDPTSLALSDDASTLWVGLEGSKEIREVALGDGAPVPGASYDVPSTQYDAPVAGPMVVLPGTTGSVAVSMHVWGISPSFMGLVVFDDGVPRPMQTPGHTGAARLTSGPAGWLYGFNDLHTGFGFYAIELQEDGPSATEFAGIVDGFGTDIVHADGLVFATDGGVIDVSEPAEPDLAGTFPFSGAVIPDVAAGRVIMLSPPEFGTANATIRELDLATFTQVGSAGIAMVGDIIVIDFVRPNSTTLAMLVRDYFGEASQLLLVDNPFP